MVSNVKLLSVIVLTAMLSSMVTLLLLKQSANAQASEAGYKIGVVDLDQAVDEYKLKTDRVARYSKEFADKEESLGSRKRDLDAKRQTFFENRANLGEEKYFDQSMALDDQLFQLGREFDALRADRERETQRLESVLARDVQQGLNALADDENFHLILRRDALSNAVAYSSPTINVTPKLIDRLNAAYAQQ